jgi:hypothetical protein
VLARALRRGRATGAQDGTSSGQHNGRKTPKWPIADTI